MRALVSRRRLETRSSGTMNSNLHLTTTHWSKEMRHGPDTYLMTATRGRVSATRDGITRGIAATSSSYCRFYSAKIFISAGELSPESSLVKVTRSGLRLILM